MEIKKYDLNSYFTSGSGRFQGLSSLKYAPHSRILSDEHGELLIVVYFLSHKSTIIDQNITTKKDGNDFYVVIKTTEAILNKGDEIAVQIIIECKNYPDLISQINNKEDILIAIVNESDSKNIEMRFGGTPTDPIPTYPPLYGFKTDKKK